jgi:nucleoside-diphosphate-sugar epimerase
MSPFNNKRIALVTGATGFIGSRLTRRLAHQGWNVHVVTRQSSRLDCLQDVLDRITVHRHDGTTECMAETVQSVTPDTVFHLASLFLSTHRQADVIPLIDSNVAYGTQLVEAMTAVGCKRLVNTGTTWQHYQSTSYRPVCLYAATKQAFEAILAYYVDAAALSVITLQLPDTYGERDRRRKLIPILSEAAETGEILNMSPGEQWIDLVHVDDVVEAYLVAEHLLDSRSSQHSDYLITSGNPLRLRDLVAMYENAVNKTVSIRWGARPYREREVMIPCQHGVVLPGWRPRVSLVDGLRRIAA